MAASNLAKFVGYRVDFNHRLKVKGFDTNAERMLNEEFYLCSMIENLIEKKLLKIY